MKKLALFIGLLGAFSLVLSAASVDGKWVAEVKTKAGKKKGGGEQTSTITFDLKSSGNALTGTVDAGGRRKAGAMQITNGKIDGDSFSFTTVQKSRKAKAEQKWTWKGTLQGDDLRGDRSREGARRGTPFTAKRK
jgi:hypothetical protein